MSILTQKTNLCLSEAVKYMNALKENLEERNYIFENLRSSNLRSP